LHDVGESEVENNPEHDDNDEEFNKAEARFEGEAYFLCPTQVTAGASATPHEENCRLAPAAPRAALVTVLPLPLNAA